MDKAAIDTRENKVAYAKLIAEVWTKPETERLFKEDPRSAALKAWMKLPEGVEVRCVEKGEPFVVRQEGDKTILELLLPPKPAELMDCKIDQWSPTTVGSFLPAGACSSVG
jgi:hypothetical protein